MVKSNNAAALMGAATAVCLPAWRAWSSRSSHPHPVRMSRKSRRSSGCALFAERRGAGWGQWSHKSCARKATSTHTPARPLSSPSHRPPVPSVAAPPSTSTPLAFPPGTKLWPFGQPVQVELVAGTPALPAGGAYVRVVVGESCNDSGGASATSTLSLARADDPAGTAIARLAVPDASAVAALVAYSTATARRGARGDGQHAPLPHLALVARADASLAISLTPAAFAGEELTPGADDPATHDRRPSPWASAVRALLPWLAPAAAAGDDAGRGALEDPPPFDAARLFRAIRPERGGPTIARPPAGLVPTLRPYQARAVAWMLARERGEGGEGVGVGGPPAPQPAALHPLWAPVYGPPPPPKPATQRSGRASKGQAPKVEEDNKEGSAPDSVPSFYVNPFTGRLARAPFPAPPPLRGGCLADEMGLGKTVETAALLLAAKPPPAATAAARTVRVPRPRAERTECVCGATTEAGAPPGTVWVQCDECDAWCHAACVGITRRGGGQGFACGGCLQARAGERVVGAPAKATLIVCPPHLLRQWASELAVHTAREALTVVVYGGQGGGAGAAPAAPASPPPAHPAHPSPPPTSRKRRRGAGASAPPPPPPPPPPDAVAAAAASVGAAAARAAPVVGASELAAADVVLTTYDCLRRDIYRLGADDGEEEEEEEEEEEGKGEGASGRQQARAATGPTRSLRHAKKYAVLPSPLTRLTWWRVVLDEAQEVEAGTSAAARLAAKLRAVHRWAVTGTPISSGIADLAGLAAFLRAAPYDAPHWWTRALADPYAAGAPVGSARLIAALAPPLGGWLWRTAKADVPPSELSIPPQAEVTVRLALSPVEAHWYRMQHATVEGTVQRALPAADWAAAAAAVRQGGGAGGEVMEVVAPAATAATDDVPDPDRTLTALEERRVLAPLLALRQACCHPQVGARGLRPLRRAVATAARAHRLGGGAAAAAAGGAAAARALHARAPMTMTQMRDSLAARARVEAEDAQRLLLAALNGGAGARVLGGDVAGGAAIYRAALAVAVANSTHIRADPLQRLHALANLSSLLGRSAAAAAGGGGDAPAPAAIPRLPSEGGAVAGVGSPGERGDLDARAAEIRDAYLAPLRVRLFYAEAEYDEAAKEAGLRTFAGEEEAEPRKKKAKKARKAKGDADADDADNDDVEQGGGWYLDAVDALITAGAASNTAAAAAASGDALAARLRAELEGADAYRASRNATSLATRLAGGHALKPLLHGELARAGAARAAALGALAALRARATAPDPALVAEAGQCGRCRGAELGAAGRTCPHCRLDEAFLAWELSLFALTTRALDTRGGARGAVSVEDALRAAQAAALRRVGRGGLGEEGEGEGGGGGGGRGGGGEPGGGGLNLDPLPSSRRGAGALVATSEIVRHPSQAERALRLLKFELGRLDRRLGGRGRAAAGNASRTAALLAAASEAVDRLEALRAVFLAARKLALAQRALLYAADELAMAEMTLQLGGGGGGPGGGPAGAGRGPAAARYTPPPAHQPRKIAELDAERAAAEADTRAAMGNLRYVLSLGTETRAPVPAPDPAATPDPASPAAAPAPPPTTITLPTCPVCMDDLGPGMEVAVLRCGHYTCFGCALKLVSRAADAWRANAAWGPARPPPATGLTFNCPTCRGPTAAAEVAKVVDGVRGEPAPPQAEAEVRLRPEVRPPLLPRPPLPAPSVSTGLYPGELDVCVTGSYGTKIEAVVRRAKWLLAEHGPGDGRMLIFSAWVGVLDVLSHALAANGVRAAQPRGPKALGDAIAAFRRGDPARRDPAALLMPVRSGANGLNLTEAAHVLLVEPQADPAVEAQAAGRVHRIGQTRPTTVHRFVVRGTVEEGVDRLARARRAGLAAGGGGPGEEGAALAAAAASSSKAHHGEPALSVKDVVRLLRGGRMDGGGGGE